MKSLIRPYNGLPQKGYMHCAQRRYFLNYTATDKDRQNKQPVKVVSPCTPVVSVWRQGTLPPAAGITSPLTPAPHAVL
jgi:hypothetical protein